MRQTFATFLVVPTPAETLEEKKKERKKNMTHRVYVLDEWRMSEEGCMKCEGRKVG